MNTTLKKIKNFFYTYFGINKKQLIRKISENSSLIHTIPDELLQRLAGNLHHFPDKTVIFSIGDQSDDVYFIISGNVEIHLSLSDKKSAVIAKIGPNQFFGELAALNQSKRAGTAVTCGPVEALVMKPDIFYDVYWSTPELQEYIKTMSRLYKIPFRGTVSSVKDTLFNLEAIKNTYHIDDRVIIAFQVIKEDIFTMIQTGDIKIDRSIKFEKKSKEGDLMREIGIANKKLVSIKKIGPWDQLSYVCNLLLENISIEDQQLDLFEATGNMSQDLIDSCNPEEILCYCMNISFGIIQNVIQQGITDIETVSATTGAGSVCGGCRSKINRLLTNKI